MPYINKDGLYCTKHSMIIIDRNKIKELFNYDIDDGYFLRVIIDDKSEHYKNLEEITQIQNILWINNISSRVRKVIKINYHGIDYNAQIIEYLWRSDINRWDFNKRTKELFQICEENFIEVNTQGDGQEYHDENNWRKDKFSDLGGFKFKD